MAGTAFVTNWIDMGAGTASIAAMIATLPTGTGTAQVGQFQAGNCVRFYKHWY